MVTGGVCGMKGATNIMRAHADEVRKIPAHTFRSNEIGVSGQFLKTLEFHGLVKRVSRSRVNNQWKATDLFWKVSEKYEISRRNL
jgi:hypothetical protein